MPSPSLSETLLVEAKKLGLLSWPALSTTLAVVFLVSRILKLAKGLKAVTDVHYLPGLRVPFQPLAFPGAAIPTNWWNPGVDFPWQRRHDLYKSCKSENISVVPFIGGQPTIYTSNVDVLRQIAGGGRKSSFIKPKRVNEVLARWGTNLLVSNSDVWRKHRRIIGPTFNNKTYALVWEQATQTVRDMFESERWVEKDVVEVKATLKMTSKFALLVIAACGFGMTFTWSSPPTSEDGSMTVQEALRVVSDNTLFVSQAPEWAWKLPFSWVKKLHEAQIKLFDFMRSHITKKRQEVRSTSNEVDAKEWRDVFSTLVLANEAESGKLRLDDDELVGNVYIMLFAGHETTAGSLTATLAYLSLDESLQTEIHEQIVSVIGDNQEMPFEYYLRLDKVLAAFLEGVRMVPAAALMIREASEDTILNFPNPVGEEGYKPTPIPKGVNVIVDMIGVQNNPRYFSEPEKFKPSRWYGSVNETDTFTAFSVGPRACIGRKFACIESVVFLSLLLRDWKSEPLLLPGESIEEWKDKVFRARLLLSLGLPDVPLRFVRRTR